MIDLPAFCIETFKAKPHRAQELTAILQDFQTKARQETGCLQYDVLQATDDAHIFIVIVKFATSALMQQHDEQTYIKAFMSDKMGELCEQVEWHDAISLT